MTAYIDRDRAIEVLKKIERKKRNCECSREVLRQADALNYAQTVLDMITPADVITPEWLEQWGRITDHEVLIDLILNDWRRDNYAATD